MIRVMRAEKLRDCLAALPGVLSRYEAGQLDFTALALDWLSTAETLLREQRVPEATEILTARTRVLASDDRSQAAGKTGAARRRERALSAVDALCQAESLLRKHLLASEGEVDAYEEKLVEAVTALIVLGHLPPVGELDRQAWAQEVWARLESEEATRPTAVWLSAALAAPDRLFLLDRILQRLRSSRMGGVSEGAGAEDGSTDAT